MVRSARTTSAARDETDWAYVEILDSWGSDAEIVEDEDPGEASGDLTEEPMDEPSEEVSELIGDALTMILKLLESLLGWIPN